MSRGFYFHETSKFREIKSSRNGEITLSITDIGKSCTSQEFLAPQELFYVVRENKNTR